MKIKRIFLLLICLFNLSPVTAQTTVIDSILFNGVWRNYRLFLPTGFTSSLNLPLVFNFHGYGSNALEQEAYSGFDAVADTARVVVCYPNGVGNAWNILDTSSNDIHFVDTLITALHNQYNINLNRVYSTGLSNGGFLSNLLGCTLSNRIAAIAPVAGTNLPPVQSTCNPSRHVPVLYIHGTADQVVEYNGTIGYSSASMLMQLWSDLNGCSSVTDTVLLPDISTSDLCRAERITWHDCDSNKQVIHYRIIDGGHTWPGAPFIIGVTNQDIVASKIIWEFFNQFSLNTGIVEVYPTFNARVYPNPFTSHLEIDLPYSSSSNLEIYSADGRLVYSVDYNESKINLDGSLFIPGIYFLKIKQNENTGIFRIVKM